MARHSKWKAEVRLPADDPSVLMHECLSKIWQTFVCYDQLDGSNLAGMELLVRQLQFIEERTAQQQEARRQPGSSGSAYDDSHLYLGIGATRGGVM
eukprot:2319034-Lingulodinium_polyedra.AAC.1